MPLGLDALLLRGPRRSRGAARGRAVGTALQLLAQPAQRRPEVLRARTFVLALGGDSARAVDEPDRRLRLVPVLSARTARAVRLDFALREQLVVGQLVPAGCSVQANWSFAAASICLARRRSRSVTPPLSWLERVTVTFEYWMRMSGWWSARSASSPTVPAKAIAALNPLRSYVRTIAFPSRFQPGSSSSAALISASVDRPFCSTMNAPGYPGSHGLQGDIYTGRAGIACARRGRIASKTIPWPSLRLFRPTYSPPAAFSCSARWPRSRRARRWRSFRPPR